jgi:hypothetical protein
MPRRKEAPTLEAQLSGEATVYEKVVGKFKKPRLSREHALQARPIRNPALKWEELDNGEVQVVLPRRKDVVGKLLSSVFYVPQSKPISLDVVGARVWKLCDGEHTVHDLTEALMEEHKLHRREAEVSLTEFLRMLGKRNMVAFVVPTEFVEMDEKEERKQKAAEKKASKPKAPAKSARPTKKGRKPKR